MKPVEYQNILAVDHLEKGYNYISSKGEEVSCPVLENISFQIEPKEFVGIMGRSGCGKTTLLSALINRMKEQLRIGEMDVDIETSLDAQRVADLTGVESIQIHNCGLCHIDADMVSRALLEYDTENLDQCGSYSADSARQYSRWGILSVRQNSILGHIRMRCFLVCLRGTINH